MSKSDVGCKAECLNEKENGHRIPYLTYVMQGDGTCYWRCESCGWIKAGWGKIINPVKTKPKGILRTVQLPSKGLI